MRRTSVLLITTLLVALPAAEMKTHGEGLSGFFVSYLGGKALDALFVKDDSTRVKALDRRLAVFESKVREQDKAIADAVRRFRRDLDSRTTKSEVQRIVNQSLYTLRLRVQNLEMRTNDIDDRLRAVEVVKFPGAIREFTDENGQRYLIDADAFRFRPKSMRNWRDKRGGPLATGILTEVSADGVLIKRVVSGTPIAKMVPWHRLSSIDQAHVLSESAASGTPVGGVWRRAKPSLR